MNKKTQRRIFIILLITILFILQIPSVTRADTSQDSGGVGSGSAPSLSTNPIDNPDRYKPGDPGGDIDVITDKANTIIGTIVTVGVIISVVTMGTLGIKYMLGSASEKAEYKKSMIPYLIGAVLLFSTSIIVNIIARIVQESKLGG